MDIPTKVPEKGFYHHYKHDPENLIKNNYTYEVVGVGLHTESDVDSRDAHMVVYRPLYEMPEAFQQGKFFWLRPLEMFMDDVNKDGKTFSRFTKITDAKVVAELEAIKKTMYGA